MPIGFEKILSSTPLSDIKAPPPFPVGTYLAATEGLGEWGESRQKKTKQIQFKCKVLSPQSDVDQQKLMEWRDETGETVMGQEFYATFWDDVRLKGFLIALGFSDSITGSEALAQAAGRQFLVVFRHVPSQDGKRIVHEVAEYKAV